MAQTVRIAGTKNRYAIYKTPHKITRSIASEVDGVQVTTGLGRIHSTTRITDSDSPYTVLATEEDIFCDTDGGAIAVNLLAGVTGTRHTVKNVGGSGNNVTLAPNGSESIEGVNANVIIGDGESFQIEYETTEGWRII